MINEDIRELAENACHFGHKVWNPKMKPYLWGKKGGVHIFDLEQTLDALNRVSKTLSSLSQEKKIVLFVSTKPQTKTILAELFREKKYPVVINKWVGGLLTNFETIKPRVRRLKDIREMVSTGDIEKFPKKEQSKIKKEMEKLEGVFSGIVDMYKLPDALVVIDGSRDEIAIREANRLGIPVYGIADSNVNPEGYTDFIPANDDAITALSFLVGKIFSVLQPLQKKG
jgi:small subunit ribosomal protein S2